MASPIVFPIPPSRRRHRLHQPDTATAHSGATADTPSPVQPPLGQPLPTLTLYYSCHHTCFPSSPRPVVTHMPQPRPMIRRRAARRMCIPDAPPSQSLARPMATMPAVAARPSAVQLMCINSITFVHLPVTPFISTTVPSLSMMDTLRATNAHEPATRTTPFIVLHYLGLHYPAILGKKCV